MADNVCHALPFISVTLQTKILSRETSNFLKQIILKSCPFLAVMLFIYRYLEKQGSDVYI